MEILIGFKNTIIHIFMYPKIGIIILPIWDIIRCLLGINFKRPFIIVIVLITSLFPSSVYPEEVQIQTSSYTKIKPLYGIEQDSTLGRLALEGICFIPAKENSNIYFSRLEFGESGNKYHVGFGGGMYSWH